jgi:hypothetical protein
MTPVMRGCTCAQAATLGHIDALSFQFGLAHNEHMFNQISLTSKYDTND